MSRIRVDKGFQADVAHSKFQVSFARDYKNGRDRHSRVQIQQALPN